MGRLDNTGSSFNDPCGVPEVFPRLDVTLETWTSTSSHFFRGRVFDLFPR